MRSEPNTKHVQIAFEVPRDPEQYRATTHFGQRAKSRVPDHLRDRVIRECIERGRCRGTTRTFAEEKRAGVKQYYAFEREIREREWRVVVGIRPVAFRNSDERHLAVTIMEVGDA
jgi:hypothetical protein